MMKSLLIIGPARSGTTLLASMIGRHSDISMLNECLTDDVFRLVGKKYHGNKLALNRRINRKSRRSRFGVVVFFKIFPIVKYLNKRVFRKLGFVIPIEQIPMISIDSYIERGAKIVMIERDKDSVISSLQKRYNAGTYKSYLRDYDHSMKMIYDLEKEGYLLISYTNLVNNPEDVMQHVCDYLELPYEERMLEGPKYNPTYKSDSFIKQQ